MDRAVGILPGVSRETAAERAVLSPGESVMAVTPSAADSPGGETPHWVVGLSTYPEASLQTKANSGRVRFTTVCRWLRCAGCARNLPESRHPELA